MTEQKSRRFIDLLGKKYQREVLETLLDKTDYTFTVNELAKETSGSYNSVSNFLRQLERFNIVEFTKKGNTNLVKYNPASKYHEVIKSLLRAENQPLKEQAEKYAESLYSDYNLSKQIKSIVLFGSVARGSANQDSDIDVLVLIEDNQNKENITQESRKRANKSNELDNEIVPVIEELSEFKENFKHDKRFEVNVMRDGIVLAGEELNELF